MGKTSSEKTRYIENLTNQLIGKNRYQHIFGKLKMFDEFLTHVKNDLVAGDIGKMSPATLGEIMCSFQVGDLMVTKKELSNDIHFAGDGEDLLRELVAYCLARVIWDRLDGHCMFNGMSPWGGRRISPHRYYWG